MAILIEFFETKLALAAVLALSGMSTFAADAPKSDWAITGNAATRGMLESGSTLKAVQKFGQNNAQQYVGNWLSALGNQQSTGLSAGNALAGYNQGNANNVSGLYQNTGAAQANSELIRGQATADALQAIGSIFTYGMGGGSGASNMAGMFGSSNFGASSFGGTK